MPELISLDQAAQHVSDGQIIALGGMTSYRRPVGFARALLRRQPRPKNLTLLAFTGGIESDLLVGGGCVKSVRTVYFGLESFGFAPMFTASVNSGNLEVIEETEQSLSMGIRARMSGVGFMPSRAWIGTDLPKLRPDVKMITDPYNDETLMAFPAVSCDVAILHGLAADRHGNVLLNNNLGVDVELVYISNRVIVTVEEIVERLERTVDGVLIPSPGIHYIAHAPRGAYPTSCYPHYPIGGGEFFRYIDACNAGKFEEYLRGEPVE
jgi:glutaconate CoA-transferase, subunit A